MIAKSKPDLTTRQRILNAALDLFATKGFDGTSMRAIARDVGLCQSSLYNHFGGKQDIFRELVDMSGPALAARRMGSPDYQILKRDPVAFCRKYALDHLEHWFDPAEQKFLSLVTTERHGFRSERQAYFDVLFQDEVSAITNYFREFALSGQIRASNPTETARLFMAGLTFVRLEHLVMSTAPAKKATVRHAVERQVETFLSLIQPVEPTS